MNREEYFIDLEARNGYCECPKLQALYLERKHVEGLEGRCDFLERNVDLDAPRAEDKGFIRVYKKATIELYEAVSKYRESLKIKMIFGNIVIRLHDVVNLKPLKNISVEKFLRLQDSEEPIITAHCNSCDQQVEVLCG